MHYEQLGSSLLGCSSLFRFAMTYILNMLRIRIKVLKVCILEDQILFNINNI